MTTEANCEVQCYMEERCMSYNLSPLVDGFHLCELSNSDWKLHGKDVMEMQGYALGRTKVNR